jgi:hypothetical protein
MDCGVNGASAGRVGRHRGQTPELIFRAGSAIELAAFVPE